MSCNDALSIGSRGTRLDLMIRKGATCGPFTAVMKNPDGTLVDLTGCTIRGFVQSSSTASTTEVALDVTSAYNTTGTYAFGITAANTGTLSSGTDELDPAALHFWFLELVDTLARVIPLYYGDAVCVH